MCVCVLYHTTARTIHVTEHRLGLKLAPETKRFTPQPLMESSPLFPPRMAVCRERRKTRGKGEGGKEVLLCWSFRSLRKLQDDASLPSPLRVRPYVFEGVDEGGR